MTLRFTQYVDLLDLHGRAAVRAYAALAPHTRLPPRTDRVDSALTDFWCILEIWLWILRNPNWDWKARPEPDAPANHDSCIAAAESLLGDLESTLMTVGPDLAVDYFGRPGTSLDVARLLAHEAVEKARAASRASGRREPPLAPKEAADVIDRTLAHWAEPDALVLWEASPALVRAEDAGDQWWVHFGVDRDHPDLGAIASGSAGRPSVTVSGAAAAVLPWLEGYTQDEVTLTGDASAVHRFRVALGHPVAPPPRRRFWRRS